MPKEILDKIMRAGKVRDDKYDSYTLELPRQKFLTFPDMPTSARLITSISHEQHARFARLANSRAMSSSKLLAALVNAALAQLSAPAASSAPNKAGQGVKRAPAREPQKYLVRLQGSDAARLEERAEARGTRPASYAAMVLMAHLNTNPPMPHGEFQALKRVVNELGGIRAALVALTAAGPHVNDLDGQAIEAVQKLVPALKTIRDDVQNTLVANSRSWSAPDA